MDTFNARRKHMKKSARKSDIPGKYLEHRQTGTSTGLAFRYLSEAILTPGKEIKVRDHHNSNEGHRLLLDMVVSIATKLQLDAFTFSKS